MLLLIDNYDSFTYNLFHLIGELGVEVTVVRNDAADAESLLDQGFSHVVISPGPCDPDRAGISLDMVKSAQRRGLPLLGVCLGHQALAQALGATIVRAGLPMHGKLSAITHDGTGLFADLPDSFTVTRYHSLAIQPASLPDSLRVTATAGDGEIMGIAHRDLPLHGIQFHPESIATEHGSQMMRQFLSLRPVGPGQLAA